MDREARGRVGIADGRTRDAGEATLHYPLGRELERLDALAQALNLRVGVGPELSPQLSQGLHYFGPDRTDDSIGALDPVAGQPASSGNSEPKSEQYQVDVATGAILQSYQRLRDARARVELQGEMPQRRFIRRLAGRFGHHRTQAFDSPCIRDAVMMVNSRAIGHGSRRRSPESQALRPEERAPLPRRRDRAARRARTVRPAAAAALEEA